MVSPPPDVGSQPAPAPASRTVSTAEPGTTLPGAAAPALDRIDIKPLDVPAALQILIAEVREAFTLLLIEAAGAAAPVDAVPGDGSNPSLLSNLAGDVEAAAEAGGTSAGAVTTAIAAAGAGTLSAALPTNFDSPAPAARALVEIVLRALPDTLDERAWGAALPRVEAALQAGMQSAVDAVSVWRDVPSIVVETTREAAQLALQVLGDEPQNPLWLRPEWLGMAPRLTRFWRRRRAHRRRLSDPDYQTAAKRDETDEYTQ